jgi:hypothetical protein
MAKLMPIHHAWPKKPLKASELVRKTTILDNPLVYILLWWLPTIKKTLYLFEQYLIKKFWWAISTWTLA